MDLEASNISHIERGASKVGLGSLVKIANVLQCSVDDLLCDSLLWEREAFENELVKLTGDCTPAELRDPYRAGPFSEKYPAKLPAVAGAKTQKTARRRQFFTKRIPSKADKKGSVKEPFFSGTYLFLPG